MLNTLHVLLLNVYCNEMQNVVSAIYLFHNKKVNNEVDHDVVIIPPHGLHSVSLK